MDNLDNKRRVKTYSPNDVHSARIFLVNQGLTKKPRLNTGAFLLFILQTLEYKSEYRQHLLGIPERRGAPPPRSSICGGHSAEPSVPKFQQPSKAKASACLAGSPDAKIRGPEFRVIGMPSQSVMMPPAPAKMGT